MTEPKKLPPLLKLALELGPLLLFFFVYGRFDILTATAVLMVAVVLSLAVTYAIIRRVPIMPLVTAGIALIFGGLTIAFNDSIFIKIKPTIIYLLFGGALLGGLAFGKSLLPVVLDGMVQLTEEGWRKLTMRWGVFFLALAVLNEFVWRTQPEALWVKLKVFGFMPLTLLFALAQSPLIMRYELKGEAADKAPEHM
ncbi:MAG: septation protein A [Hyphomicrobiales bacterium]|nr:septation protein A [Hyphomicrobiales bacterium]